MPDRDRRHIRYFAEYALLQAFLFALRCLPVRWAFRVADSLAWLIHHAAPRRMSRHSIARDNLRQVFGDQLTDREIDRLIHGMWRHLCRLVCEMIQLPRRMRLSGCSEYLEFSGRERCVQAMLSGRPVLFLGGHFGNWEMSVATFGHVGFPVAVVARKLDNPWLQAWFRQFRETRGNSLILKHGAGNQLVETLERGGLVSLLCDQDAGRSGIFADFFGKPASTYKSIGLLALQYDALVVVGGAFRLPATDRPDCRWVRFRIATQDVIDTREFQGADGLSLLTQRFTSSLEQLIRNAPEQYFWLHRRWKTAAGARRRRKKLAA